MSQDVHKHNHEKDAPRTVGVTENCTQVCDFTYICTCIYVLTYMHSVFPF